MGAAAGEGPPAGPGAGAGGLCPGGAGRRGRWASPSQAAALPPSPFCCPQEGKPDRGSPYIQVLEEDWRQALRDHQEQASTIFSLRKDLRQAEALRARVCSWGRLTPGLGPSWLGGLRTALCPHSAGDLGGARLSAQHPYRAPSWQRRAGSLTQLLPLLPRDGQGQPSVWKLRACRDLGARTASPSSQLGLTGGQSGGRGWWG